MNLVQIQERLKDMPLQAVIQYANGMNPDVPPYLALGELNRRKKMEQAMQPAEMPQGTVKDQLENEVGLAALQKQLMNQLQTQGLRQRQAAMSQGQQMARMPGPAPQGVPQPEVPEEVEMANGGVATLTVPDDQFEFGSGGIIAFDRGGSARRTQLTEADLAKLDELKERLGQAKALEQAFLEPGIMGSKQLREFPERKVEYDKAIAARRQLEQEMAQTELGRPVVAPQAVDMNKAVQEGRVLTTNPITPDRNFPDNRGTAQRFPPGPPPSAQVTPGPARQNVGIATVAPPTAPAVAPIAQSPATQALAAMIPQGGTKTVIKDYETERAEAAKKDPYLTKRPGEKLEDYLSTLERRDREDQERFQRMEQERTRGALWKSLMAAGEASRGQRGIGALLGGFGRTSETEMEAARGREEKQAALMREREMNRVKMAQEIETARIAASKGDFAAKREADMNAAKYDQKDREISGQLQSNLAQIEAANARTFAELQARANENKLSRETQILVAKIQAAASERPSEAERIFAEYQNRLKADPSGKSAEEYMTAIQRAKGLDIRAGDARTKQIAAQIKPKQEELEKLIANPISMKDPRVQQLRKEIDDLTRQLGGSSQAPLGSRENPIPIR